MTAWARVRDRIIARDTGGLADLVIALSGAERAEVARQLPDLRRELRAAADRRARAGWSLRLGDGDDLWEEDGPATDPWDTALDAVGGHGAVLRIAGAGVLSGPAATVSWLTRREFADRQAGVTDLVRTLAARPAGWQAEVAVRLARRIRTADDPNGPLALALLRACGVPPPEHDPLVTAWLSSRPGPDDPLIDALLPRIFEAEGAGRALRWERLEPVPTHWLSLLDRLRESGRVSRAELLDGCLSRFLRGGDALGLRFFIRLHELLDPTPQEAAARARDYLRLLPTAPGTVAEPALTQVRQGGPHEEAEVIEAIGALTFRPEAKLALEGLRWLERELPNAVELAPALATAFGHPSYEVQGRAARIALKHAAAFAPARETLAQAVPMLPPTLGARVAAVHGGEAAAPEPPEVFTPPPLPEPYEPEPFPEPTLDLPSGMCHWPDHERWLAAFTRQASGDREELRRALSGYGDEPYLFQQTSWTDTRSWFSALALEVIAPGTDPGPPEPEPVDPWAGASFKVSVQPVAEPESDDGEREEEEGEPERMFGNLPERVREDIFEQVLEIGVSEERVAAMRDGLRVPPPGPGEPRDFRVQIGYFGFGPMFMKPEPPDPAVESRRRRRLPQPWQVSPPHLFVLRRLSEVYEALRAGTLPPVLLATPTRSTGHLDPDVLVDRLEECAAAGVEPLAADLVQALVRLPRGRHPGAAARAARTGSQAAATAAAWLAGEGLPDPETGLRWAYLDGAVDRYLDEHEPDRPQYEVRLKPILRAEPVGHAPLDDLLGDLLREPAHWSYDDHGGAMGWWPAVLPSHREVVAVNYLPFLLHPTIAPVFVAALADADGPVGETLALTLAYFVAAGHPEAPPLLLRMAARGDLPAEAVGEQVALLLRRTARFDKRAVVRVLAEAARQGAHAAVWRLLTTLLPALLPDPGERPGVAHTQAMALAADTATWAAARGAIPQVTAYAAAGGRSRFARECVRLRDQLGRDGVAATTGA
ncbi:hypothetical protein [Nonomuraea sp. CA-218870]|uniref:hypothetical protein n=1 Tax=Nonomuraea sp. CA-218870 TaxID=3239998 RepID=UPI003D8D4FF0